MAHVRISSETIGDEFYLYMNGKLVYKRWLTNDKGRMFYENEGIREMTNELIKNK
jgi:hypothetical protein